jgi:acetyltransferase-like isoleucine patch superfamily enzyme
MTSVAPVFIHDTAEISPDAHIGAGSCIWHGAQIREGSSIGSECVIGKDVYVDSGVVIGDRVKIQNNVSVYHGVTIEDGAFIGPHVCFTNDVRPRAITLGGSLKREQDWIVGRILVCVRASIGAGSVILPNVTIGLYALVGAGSVITRSVPDHALCPRSRARLWEPGTAARVCLSLRPPAHQCPTHVVGRDRWVSGVPAALHLRHPLSM